MWKLLLVSTLTAFATSAFGETPKPPVRLAAPTNESKELGLAVNGFAADLFSQLRTRDKGDGNLFFSPYSISAALAMAHEGAAGPTADEMAKALRLPKPDTARAGFENLHTRLQASRDKAGFDLSVANRLWPMVGFELKPDYLKRTMTTFHADLVALDFAQSAAAAKTINDYIARETHDRIKDLIPASALDASTRLVLTNAIYFKGDWTKPFQEAATQDGDFALSGGKKTKAKLMHQSANFRYARVDAQGKMPAFQVLEMPYGPGDLSMVVFLPAVDKLPDLESALDARVYENSVAALREQEVQVTFPRFRIEDQFGLNKTLQSIGIKTAFTDKADFSGISTKEGLYISDVVHKAFVEVNEKGTEAAAATGLIMKTAAMPVRREPAVFTADHPFVFAIRDRGTSTILFLGRLGNPAK